MARKRIEDDLPEAVSLDTKGIETMNEQINLLNKTKRIGVGLAFLLFPLIFIFAFATHPNLLNPKFLGPLELISRAHNNSILHLGHALVTLSTGLLVVVAIHFMNLLKNKSAAWYGFISK
ncbi:MAG: hypothetical protein WA125_13465 [Desulfosporosinus sp.]